MGSVRMAGKSASLVFMDFEATGLIGADKPRSGRITEMAFMGVLRGEVESAVRSPKAPPPRVRSQLVLPVYPGADAEWSPKAVEMTGLSEELMAESSTLEFLWPNVLNFLRSLPKPLVLVAHNGDRFDFPLLRDEMRRCRLRNLPDGVFTLDSLDLFRYADSLEAQLLDVVDTGEELPLHPLPQTLPTASQLSDGPTDQSLEGGGLFWRAELDTTPKGGGEKERPQTPPQRQAKGRGGGWETPEAKGSVAGGSGPRRQLFPAPAFPASPKQSYALAKLHERACPAKAFPDAHQAMGDVQALLDIFISYGYPVLDLADQMRKPFPAL